MKKLLFAATLLAASLSAAPTFTLDPANGIVSGAPGSVAGWGFTITNDSDFLLFSAATFCAGANTPPCTFPIGTFGDYLVSQHLADPVVIAPGGTLTQAFNPIGFQGLGEFAIAPGAAPGSSAIGTIYLVYDSFSCDFINDLSCTEPNQTAFSETLSAIARVNVVDPNTAGVPEPSTLGMVGLAASALAFRAGRRSPY